MKKLSLAICLLASTCTELSLADTSSDYAGGKALFEWAEYRYPTLFPALHSDIYNIDDYVVRYYQDSGNYLGVREGLLYGFGPAFIGYTEIGGGVYSLGSLSELASTMAEDGFETISGPSLVVSEAVAKDPDGGPDWFELYSAGTEAVSIGAYQVKDGKDDRALTSLPNITLQPGEYVVIIASDSDEYLGDPNSVPFNLGSNDRVQLYLNDVLVNDLDWDEGEAPATYSFGRFPGPFSDGIILEPTPGITNQAALSGAVSISTLGAVGTMLSSESHSLSFSLDLAQYQAMVSTYNTSGEKQWLEASITLDGEVYDSVGIRLKGNSSLRGITIDDDPVTVPWLVKLDKFIDDQEHKGLEEFVIRSNTTSTALNEAVALELLDLAGLASQDAITIGFSVNGGPQTQRLAIEHPDDEWMEENFDDSGALYKAESTGDYSYRGDDPASYEDVFDQEAGKDNADLTPLITFLKFINQSDDETFKAQLGSYLDVDSFAAYLAMQDLLDNFDDIDGPGNNSYLYFDTRSIQFTVVPWDYNLAFGVQNVGGNGDDGAFPGGQVPLEGAPDRPAPGEFPPNNIPPTDAPLPDNGGGVPGGNFGGGSNILSQRFLADTQWNALYEQKLTTLRAELYQSGIASDLLSTWSAIISTTNLVEESIIESESASIASYLK